MSADDEGEPRTLRPYDPRRIVRNLRAAVVGEAAIRGASFLAAIVVARSVSSSDFGRFSFAVAIVSVGLLVSDTGLQVAATRAIANDRQRSAEYVTSALALGGTVALLTYGALALAGALQLLPFGVTKPTLIFGLVLFASVGTNAWGSHLRGFERQDLIYLAYGVSSVALLMSVVVASHYTGSVSFFLSLWVAAYLLRLLLVFAFLSVAIERPRLRLNRVVLRTVAVAAPAAAAAYILQGAYSHIDVVLIGFLVSAANVGRYAAAYRLIDGVTFLTAGAATAAVFPVFSRLSRESPQEIPRLYGAVTRFSLAILVPLSFLLVALGEPIVRLVFDHDRAQITRLFDVLAPCTVLISLNFFSAFVALSMGRMRLAIGCTGVAAVVNVLANLVGVPLFGTTAAAVATFLAEIALLALFQISFGNEFATARILRPQVVAAGVSTTAVVLITALPHASGVIGIGGVLAALPLLRITGAFDQEDGSRFRRAVTLASSR